MYSNNIIIDVPKICRLQCNLNRYVRLIRTYTCPSQLIKVKSNNNNTKTNTISSIIFSLWQSWATVYIATMTLALLNSILPIAAFILYVAFSRCDLNISFNISYIYIYSLFVDYNIQTSHSTVRFCASIALWDPFINFPPYECVFYTTSIIVDFWLSILWNIFFYSGCEQWCCAQTIFCICGNIYVTTVNIF